MKQYKIGLNALSLKKRVGGIESSYYNTVKFLLKNDNQNQYFLFIGKNAKYIFEDFKNIRNLKIVVLPIDTNNSKLRVVAEYTLLNFFVLLFRINLMHHLCDYMPRLNFCKTVTTIHDLSGFFYHENYPPTPIMEHYYNYIKTETKETLKRCDKIIAISEFTKREILKYYPDTNENKITVINQSLDTRKKDAILNENFLNELNVSKPYIFSTSIIRPHKNYEFLIKTFNNLKAKYNIPHQLVIAGGMGNEMKQRNCNTFLEEIEKSKYKNDIKYLGYVDNKYMSTLYSYADIYVTSTVYEGFGMPLLEAMTYKKPIACSNSASLPEVGGNACIYFNPSDVNDTSKKIYTLLIDNNLQEELRLHYKERLEKFNWDKIIKQIMDVYKELLGRG